MPVNRSSPVILNTNTAPYVAATGAWSRISAGFSNSLAISTIDSKIYAWGSGFATNALPVAPRSWSKVSVGISHTLAIRSDGLLFAWGGNNGGQLGDGTQILQSSPVQIGTSSWTAIAAGLSHSIAVDAAGILYAWGTNDLGQLGDGTVAIKTSPVRVLTNNFPVGNSWIALETGGSYNYALEANGGLFAWGTNSNGELASNNSTTVIRDYPYSWTQMYTTFANAYGLRSDGLLFGWGAGSYVGDGTTVSKSSPVQIGTSSWTFLTAFKNDEGSAIADVYAIHSNGSLFAWGVNQTGQLGDGTTTTKTSPVKIGSDSWIKIAAGARHVLGINSGGFLYSWGNNSLGQLGNNQLGFSTSLSSPTLIAAVSANTFLSVNAAANSSYAIRNDGRLLSWGNNAVGQLGLGVLEDDLYFDYSAGLSWSKIASGLLHYVALRSDGAVFTGGYNLRGQLGDGTTLDRSSPVKVGALSYTNVGAGEYHSFAIASNGALYAWGWNDYYQLGDGTAVPKSSPVKIGSDSWTAVSGGALHSVGANSTGRLFTWGYNLNGEMGSNEAGTITVAPTTIYNHEDINSHSFNQVAAGVYHCVALSTNNKLFLWGNDTNGQLGDLRFATARDSRSWTTMSTGNLHTLAIASNGALHAWGYPDNGQLGDGTTVHKSSPVQIGSNSWIAVATTGGLFGASIAIVANGALFGWGSNATNGLSTTSRSSPVQIGSSSWTYVTGGREHFAAITSDGKLFTWGVDRDGKLGNWNDFAVNLSDRSSPVQVAAGISFTTVAAGGSHSLAIASNGALYAWGRSAEGQLGNGTTSQQPAVTNAMSWTTLAFASSTNFGIASNGALYAWGNNERGQTGDGTTITKNSPIKVGSDSWTSIAAGGQFVLGIVANGAMYSWGRNTRGQLGDGSTFDKSTPVKLGSESWSKVFTSRGGYWSGGTGSETSYAIHSNGALYTWGLNHVGQLGDGTTISKSSPIQIGSDSWTMIGPGGEVSLGSTSVFSDAPFATGIVSNGALYAWGHNSLGQLGDGTTVSKSSPVKIGADSWSAVSSGEIHALALHANASVFAWGNNNSQRLGDGTTIGRSSPVKVSTTLSFTTISAENFTSHALHSNSALYGWGAGTYLGDGTTVAKGVTKIGASSWTFITGGGAVVAGLLSGTNDFYLWGAAGTPGGGAGFVNPYFLIYGAAGLGGGGPGISDSRFDAFSSPVAVSTFITQSYVLQPTQIGALSWSAIATGDGHSLGITSNGALYAWGIGTTGQLGDNTTISKSSPVKIGSDSWASVGASLSTSYGKLANGRLMAWGFNTGGILGGGQVGDSTGVNRSSPVFVTTTVAGSSWNLVSANPSGLHAMGILANGMMVLWGSLSTVALTANVFAEPSTFGQTFPLGLGPKTGTTNYSTVARKIDDNSWTQIGASKGNTTLAILSNGSLYAWGNNQFGMLGDGTTTNKSSPVKIGSSSWSLISAGKNHTWGVVANGALFAWGLNGGFQLGDGTSANKSSPVQVYISGSTATPGSWTAINALGNGGQGVAGGILYAWGSNTQGEAGRVLNATTVFYPSQVGAASIKFTPTSVGTSSWSMIDAGIGGFALGIVSNGALFTWGLNTVGTLGDGTTANKSSPVKIGSDSWSQVSGGFSTAAGVVSNGRGYTWGGNAFGQLGSGGVAAILDGVDSLPTSPKSVSGEILAYSYITANGALYTWAYSGSNSSGQIGDGTTIAKSSPVQLGSISWTQVAMAASHGVAIAANGALYAWGNNALGQLGDGTTVPKSSPVKIGAESWAYVSAVSDLNLAVHSNGSLFAWGLGTSGQLGDGTTITKSSPVKIGAESWIQVQAIVSGGSGIIANGALYVWGAAASGQIGDGTTVAKSSPQKVGASSWLKIATGVPFQYMVASLANGQLYAWGLNSSGQLGDGASVNKSSPVVVTGLYNTSWTAISAQYSACAAVTSNGQLYTWGGNASGQLGDGTTVSKTTGTRIGTSSWSFISSGQNYTWGTYANGALYIFGVIGGKGNNTTVLDNRSSPVVVGAESTFSRRPGTLEAGVGVGASTSPASFAMITAGISNMGVIFSNSRMFAWGLNSSGQLGYGATSSFRLSPDIVANTTTFTTWPQKFSDLSYTKIGVGGGTAAIAANGALYTWGVNSAGTVGDGTTINRSSPVKIGALSWTQIGTALGIVANGALYSWGSGALVGDGTTVGKSSPIQIGSSSWTFVSSGSSKYAIDIYGRLFAWGGNSVSGKLGDGTTIGRSSPVLIGEHGFTYAQNFGEHSAAIKHNTDLFIWGDNGAFYATPHGKLGDGTTISKSSPVFLEVTRFVVGSNTYTLSPTLVNSSANSTTYSDVATGNNYYLATVKGSGIIHTWGLNGLTGPSQANKLGFPASYISVPVQIGATITAANVAAGNTHSGAIRK